MNVVPHNAIILHLGDLWPLESFGVEWISNLGFGGPSFEGFDKLVVDFLLDIDSSPSSACLACRVYKSAWHLARPTLKHTMVVHIAKVGPTNGLVDICVLEYDVRALAAQF